MNPLVRAAIGGVIGTGTVAGGSVVTHTITKNNQLSNENDKLRTNIEKEAEKLASENVKSYLAKEISARDHVISTLESKITELTINSERDQTSITALKDQLQVAVSEAQRTRESAHETRFLLTKHISDLEKSNRALYDAIIDLTAKKDTITEELRIWKRSMDQFNNNSEDLNKKVEKLTETVGSL